MFIRSAAASPNLPQTATPKPPTSEPTPAPPTDGYVSVTFLPQDLSVSQPEQIRILGSDLGSELSGPRMKTEDSIPVATADSNGNYIYDVNDPRFDQVNVHSTVAKTIQTYEHYMGHSTGWSFNGPLIINPHAGEGKTAYYSRWDDSINFFQWDSPSAGKVVKTSQSLDIASHETGHAILDGLRPGLLGGSEGSAFHEGFGDSTAILHALQYDSNLEKILAENGGDFSKPSLISRLAEEFGTAFNKEDDNPNNDDHPYYRTALNDFKYQKPSTLPSDTYPGHQPEEVLTSEAHSFSRVWSGSFYSMLGALYDKCEADGAASKLDALRSAREVLGSVWGPSLDLLPAANLKYANVATGMLKVASQFEDGKYFETFAKVILDRNLLTQDQIDHCHQPTAVPTAQLSAFVRTENEAASALRLLAPKLGLPDGLPWVADTPLPGANGGEVLTFRAPQRIQVDLGSRGRGEIEASSGLTLNFDKNGKLQDQTYTPVTADDIQDAQTEARHLEDEKLLAGTSSGMFQTVDGPASGVPFFQRVPTWS